MRKEKEIRGKECNRLGKTAKHQKLPIVAGYTPPPCSPARKVSDTEDTSSDRDRSNGPRTRGGTCVCSSPYT